MTSYDRAQDELRRSPRRWLVTGAAGFIGSNLVERLLQLGQTVTGLDNFSTGRQCNLDDVQQNVGPRAWARFTLVRGDIRDLQTCHQACAGVDYVLHEAALGSVPRSLEDPVATNASNVSGSLNMLVAARDARVARFVYAASSSTYGDHPGLPKVEEHIGRPLSPYAVTKYVNELYASVFQRNYGMETTGLRYFNVFGRRQDPDGAYAAVIPKWIGSLLEGTTCRIHGDGETSRDFCYIENVVQANILAATAADPATTDEVYNIACGDRTTLNEIYALIRTGLSEFASEVALAEPVYGAFRAGDVRHSLADITKARTRLGYVPAYSVAAGLGEALGWYVADYRAAAAQRSDPIRLPAPPVRAPSFVGGLGLAPQQLLHTQGLQE